MAKQFGVVQMEMILKSRWHHPSSGYKEKLKFGIQRYNRHVTGPYLNSNIEDEWGKEQKITKTIHGDCEIKILSKSNYYKVLWNNKILSFFVHRKNTNIKYLVLNESVKDFVFKVM